MTEVVVATRNKGKLREFGTLLSATGWTVLGLADAGISVDPEETGSTFSENARQKALAYSRETSLPVLADDSGLEVSSLGGRPGIHSARYAGNGAADSERIAKLLAELRNSSGVRDARFVCVLALAREERLIAEAEGECRGVITDAPRGTQGFGYDPVFLFPELGRTYAELSAEEKNRVSHRARAVAALLQRLAGGIELG